MFTLQGNLSSLPAFPGEFETGRARFTTGNFIVKANAVKLYNYNFFHLEMCGRPKKDTVFSWIYLGVVMFTVQLLTGIVESFGILLAVFVEYFGESKSEAGMVKQKLYHKLLSFLNMVNICHLHFVSMIRMNERNVPE